jgi:hypothetical protein
MMKHVLIVAALLVTSSLTIGCKSDDEKCREAAETTYTRKLAECKDATCKKAYENKAQWIKTFVDACK